MACLVCTLRQSLDFSRHSAILLIVMLSLLMYVAWIFCRHGKLTGVEYRLAMLLYGDVLRGAGRGRVHHKRRFDKRYFGRYSTYY